MVGTLLALVVAGSCAPQVLTGSQTPAASGRSASPSPTEPGPNSMRAPSPTAVEPPTGTDGLPPVVSSIKTKEKVVFLTVDDGYTKDPKVVNVLRDRDVPITPFVTRNAIADNRNYFAGVSELTGQTIQNHSISHPQLPYRGLDGQEKEICGTSESYQEWFGTRPWMLRPPYGEWNGDTKAAAKACKIDYLVMWTVSLPTSQLRYQVGNKLRPGDIILTHWRTNLYKDLPGTLDDIKKQGFKIGALQDWLPRR